MLAQSPEVVDPHLVGTSPEPRAQQKAGENEPGLLMVRRLLPPGHTAFQSRPQSADEARIPFALWHPENLLQVPQEPHRRQRLSPVRGAVERASYARLGSFERLSGDIRLSRYRRVWHCYGFRSDLAVLLVRAQIEFQWPALPDRRVRADARDLQ